MFCNTVWNGLYILPYGDIRLCSIGNNVNPELEMNAARDDDGRIMNILTHSIKDIMNSDKHREVRLVNLKDPTLWSEHCSCCEKREIVAGFKRNHPNKSRRIYLIEQIETGSTATENNFSTKADKDGNVDWYPSSLDIRFGNLCNQKCIMCSPEFSNLWYDDWTEWNSKNKYHNGKQMILVKNKHDKWIQPTEMQWYEDPRWWPKFEEMAPHLKHIYVTGGEPMLVPAHDIMLDKLIEMGYAKNILLEYDTNCSVVNDKLVERWRHFRKVDIRGSMDATEREYELIRFGGKWEKFKTNVLRLKEYEKETNGQIRLSTLTSCVQMSTAFSIAESEEWCNSIGVKFHIRFLEGPRRHTLVTLPTAAKQEIIDFYKDSPSEKAKLVTAFLKNHMDAKYQDISHAKEFIKFMDFLDTRRGTDWKTIIPRINTLLSKYVNN